LWGIDNKQILSFAFVEPKTVLFFLQMQKEIAN